MGGGEESRANAVTVVGTGSWGTTLAILAARQGRSVYLLARTESEAAVLREENENRRFLPGFQLPEGVTVTADPEPALSRSALVLMVVPSQTMRANVRSVARLLRPTDHVVVSCAKGLEIDGRLRMTQVIEEELGEGWNQRLAVLSGPNLSKEIVAGRPATTVVASANLETAKRVQSALTGGRFRVYTNPDLVGVEMAGALKNIIAIAAGMADGMQAGDSAKAAIITRGLAEIARLGLACGASLVTFAGLAGLGDMIATCASPLSRNRTLGQEMARGQSLQEVTESLGGQVAEGVPTTVAARGLAKQYGVEMPITEQLYQVFFEQKDPMQGLNALLAREPTDEFLSLGVPAPGSGASA